LIHCLGHSIVIDSYFLLEATFQLLAEKHFNFLANLRKLKKREFLTGGAAPRYPPGLRHFNFTAYGTRGHVTQGAPPPRYPPGLRHRGLRPPLTSWPTALQFFCLRHQRSRDTGGRSPPAYGTSILLPTAPEVT
jgi:hypothetical protein